MGNAEICLLCEVVCLLVHIFSGESDTVLIIGLLDGIFRRLFGRDRCCETPTVAISLDQSLLWLFLLSVPVVTTSPA
eukprot:1004471-Pyramimonas_sp.AAC.1